VVAAVGVWRVWGYHDAATRWTAVGAILAGVALLAAVVGVPFAFASYFKLQDEVKVLAGRAEVKAELRRCAKDGLALLAAWDHDEAPEYYREWVEETEATIARLAGDEYRLAFRAAAGSRSGDNALSHQCDYLMNYLIPSL
jgi:hypothetical protein